MQRAKNSILIQTLYKIKCKIFSVRDWHGLN